MSAFRVLRRFRDLLDVNWGTFADEDVPQYDAGSGKFVGVPMSGGGDVGSQTLAEVLANGGDPEGNPITGPLDIVATALAENAFRILQPPDNSTAGENDGVLELAPGIVNWYLTYSYNIGVPDESNDFFQLSTVKGMVFSKTGYDQEGVQIAGFSGQSRLNFTLPLAGGAYIRIFTFFVPPPTWTVTVLHNGTAGTGCVVSVDGSNNYTLTLATDCTGQQAYDAIAGSDDLYPTAYGDPDLSGNVLAFSPGVKDWQTEDTSKKILRVRPVNNPYPPDTTTDLASVDYYGTLLLTPRSAAKAPLVLKGGTLPASADLSASQAAVWYDPTNGAAYLMIKAKQADGTVKTLALPLSNGTAALVSDLAAYQPLDSDLTAIAALTTTSYGRAFLALADAAAGRTALGLGSLATQSGTFSGTSSGTNTGDQTSVSGNAGTATKLAATKNIDGQAFDGSADITVIAPGTHAATGKTTPADADELPLVDSAASNVLKKLTWANLKATLKTYFDTLYAAVTHTHAASDIASGTIAQARLGTGSGGAGTKVLYDDQTYKTPSAGGSVATDVIFDAKGDLAVGTGADTAARLAVGGDGKVPFADSGATPGVAWGFPQAPSGIDVLPAGALVQSFPRWYNLNATAPTSGTLCLVAVQLQKGVTYSTIKVQAGGTGASVPTHQIAGLYDDHLGTTSGTARALLRGSTDLLTTAWAANAIQTFTLTTPYVATRTGVFYIGVFQVATTPAQIYFISAGITGVPNLLNIAPSLGGSSNTGLTTALPDPANAPAASSSGANSPFYAYLT